MKNRMILTTEGVKRMRDITPGYSVYSYEDGSPLMIVELEPITINEIVEIHSHDGRTQRMTMDEYCVLAGHDKIPFKEIKFNERSVRISRQPDPYTAGFIFYGTDLDEERISVPTKSLIYMSAPIRKYHIIPGEVKGDRTYLKWEADGKDFTWHNFFLGHWFDTDSPYTIIPFAYQYGSHAERMQFIQGVFDAGHIDGFEPYGVAIAHKRHTLVVALQRILWSLNITSSIQFQEKLGWVLCADTTKEIAANFYYNEDYIRNCLKRDDIALHPDNVLYDSVRVNELAEPQIITIPKLQVPGTLYVDIDYMPIASC